MAIWGYNRGDYEWHVGTSSGSYDGGRGGGMWIWCMRRRRQLGDAGLAEDATQGVFVLVVRKGIVEPTVGWLLKATYFGCREVLRRERRRRHHERKAGQMRATEQSENAEAAEWDRIEPVLDGALLRLRAGDREAIELRFLEDRSLKAVGEKLGISEEAARKRVERALERLREMLMGRGVSAGTGLGVVLAGRCVQTAPAGVHAVVASGAAGAGAMSVAAAISRMILMGAMKIGVGIAAGGDCGGGAGGNAGGAGDDESGGEGGCGFGAGGGGGRRRRGRSRWSIGGGWWIRRGSRWRGWRFSCCGITGRGRGWMGRG